MRKHTILLALILIGQLLNAQVKSFTPNDSEKFLKELSSFMQASKKKEGKDLVEKQFAPVFISQVYTQSQRAKVYDLANLFLDKKYKAYPHFESLIKGLTAFPSSGRSEEQFNDWYHYVLKIMESKKYKKYLDEVLAQSATLFESNTFYKSAAVEWKSMSPDWYFEFDSIPSVIFPALDLNCYAKGDSSSIKGTKGAFFPTIDRWFGQGGRITWERADFDPLKTYAEFQDYSIRTKGASFVIDSVVFYNEFFEQPLMGQLTEKVQADKDAESASYPKFESYNKRLQIKNIFKSVDYDGGFTMRGNKLAGSGTHEEPAVLTFYYDDKPFLISKGLEFIIRPDRISSSHSSVVFYLEKDSVYHPDIQLKFSQETRKLSLVRTEEGVSKSPYYNSYHNVDMYFGALYWNVDDPLMELGSIKGSSERNAGFESKDYYKKQRYDAMIGFGFKHPLVQIRDFTRGLGYEEFYAKELALYLKLSEEQTHLMLIDLNNKGFVAYDMESRYCLVKQKMHNYMKASAGKVDYDVLQFNSTASDGRNAQINLLNNNLLMRGVRSITLSDSQRVTILPANEEVVLKKNRDFRCGGRIYAGNFEFMGKEYFFNYEEFRLDLNQVDSCRIYVEDEESEADQYGNRDMIRVKNVLEGVAGTLKIDAPSNKSGVQSETYPQYPIFNCNKKSFVYYDNSAIHGGVYNRDDFYYAIEPFEFDSLDNFVKEDLTLAGTLISGGIFPDIEEPLVLMEDYSLGFNRDNSGGMAMYEGKSKFINDVKLDYNGLQGSGELNYLTTTALSHEYLFFPDSTKGKTHSYFNQEQPGSVEMPKASAFEVEIAFFPKEDLLKAKTIDEPINFFKNEANLDGELQLRPKGMTGSGMMTFDGAELESGLFNYKMRAIKADTSDFRLMKLETEGLAFKTENVNADVDFDKREGLFKSNDEETKLDFPENQYICYMDQFKWFMDQEKLELSSGRKVKDDFVIDTDAEKTRSNFFSVNELQDSLNFLAPNAVYDIKSSVITAKKIKYIVVADSKITPDSGKVVIRKRAKMETLLNATVLSNYVTQYHQIFNAELDIHGRLSYNGAGDYAYVDENNKKQVIHLNSISVDTLNSTVGKGVIMEEDQFFLSPFFEFYGDFSLKANDKDLLFAGGTRLLHTCETLDRNWMKFEASIDPKDIFIPVDTGLTDTRASKLGAGVMLTDDSPYDIYSTFMSAKLDRKDKPVMEAYGYLYYDKITKSYLLGSKEKIRNQKLAGQIVRLNTQNCEVTGNGKLDFHSQLGLVEMQPIGDVNNFGFANEMQFSGVATIDFMLESNAWKRFTDQVLEWPDLKSVDVGKTRYEQSIVQLMGQESSDKLISELNLNGQLKKIPDELQKALYLCDIKFQWDGVDQSFLSDGPIGIAHIGKKQVFQYLKGKIEIEKRRSFDVLRMYLELDPGNWYYFEYKNEVMTVSSSDKEFLGILQEVKEDKRRMKENGMNYSYIVTNTTKKKNDFIDRFREFD